MKAVSERFLTPVLNKNTVYRRKIIERIDRLSKRGILFVHAPAGYGKTTAVALWARYKNAVWLPLDEYCSEAAEIFKRLLTALSVDILSGDILSGDVPLGEISEEFEYAPLEYTLNALEKSGKGEWPQAVVIDDFHLCTDSQVARALPLIRSRIPADTAFIIISRNPLPDVLIEQKIKGAVQQISDLQFSVDDIVSLFSKNKKTVTQYQAEIIHRQTDGWAAALAAILLSNSASSTEDILNSDALHGYLRANVVDYWDHYHVLKKCAICDILNPGLVGAITGQDNAWEIITAYAEKTGLVIRHERNIFHFHALLKEFLESELERDTTIDKQALYKTAARYFKENGDILRALDITAKSRDIAMLEEYLQARIDEYGKFDADIWGYVSAIYQYVYKAIPPAVIKQSLHLSLGCYAAMFTFGRIQESFEWLDAADELLWSGEYSQADIIFAVLYMHTDPRKKVEDIPGGFLKIMPLFDAAKPGRAAAATMTYNFPFFHKAQVDYANVSPELDAFLADCDKYTAPVLGSVYRPLFLLIEAGVRYERCELERAEKIAGEAVELAAHFPPEIQFASLVLHAEIMRVQGKKFSLEPVSAMIAATKARYLYGNFNAFAANIQLHNGDVDTANQWLSQAEVESGDDGIPASMLVFYRIYQYFTTARSLMVTGKMSRAETLLRQLADLSLGYRRVCDHIEALTLQSICLWHMKRLDDSIKAITGAIVKASGLQLLMPIIKEGGDILPILYKLLNRLKYGYGAELLAKSFVNTLYLEAKAMSRHRGVMVKGNKNKPVKLSPRQREILTLLEQNLSYKEISAKIGVKVTTVDDHIDKLYEKLGVSNAHDAVLKARELRVGGSPTIDQSPSNC